MDRPGVGLYLWLLLLVQVALWTIPCASVELGDGCTDSANCTVANSSCNGSLCVCDDTHFQIDNTTCTLRVEVDGSCSLPSGQQENCVSGAVCDTGSTCRAQSGQSCPADGSSCPQTTTCVGGKCVCDSDHYNNNGLCLPRVAVGETCTADTPKTQGNCVNDAVCDTDTDSKCRLAVGETCSDMAGTQGKCVTGAVCDNDHTCRLAVGETCSDMAGTQGKCVTGAVCDSDNKCRYSAGQACTEQNCVTTALCENSVCKIKLKESCTSSPTDYCQSDTKCVDVGGGNNEQQCRRTYGSNCDASDECQSVNNEDCLTYDSGQEKKCLCSTNYFRKKTNDVCLSVNSLQVDGLTQYGDKQETSLGVQWSKPTDVDQAEYKASLNQSQPPGSWSSDQSATFSQLTSGEEFTVVVSIKTKKDPMHGYSIVENPNAGSVKAYTKPAKPGKLVEEYHKVPSVTLQFYPSSGTVLFYSVTVERVTENVPDSDNPSATFTNLNPETNYTVVIEAHSHNITSEQQTDFFFVDAAGAGEVSDLQIQEHGGRWVIVSWQKPQQPNGNITGYAVQLVSGTCRSGLAVVCSDCQSTGLEIPSVPDCAFNSNIPKSRSELEATVVVNVTDLQPDVSYTVRVTAYNQKGPGTNRDESVVTNQEAALTLKSMSVVSSTKKLEVRWEPQERTGPTTYTVSWSEKTSSSSPNFTPKGTVNIIGYKNTTYVIEGLLSFWEYRVSVFPFTPVPDHPATATTQTQRTSPTAPEVVTFTLTQPADTAQQVVLSAQCPPERQRNANITAIAYHSTIIRQGVYDQVVAPVGQAAVSDDCHVTEHFINVVAEASYNFSVYARAAFLNGSISTHVITITARPPSLQPPSGGQGLVVAGKSTTSQVTVEVCNCLVSTDQGRITMAGITLCVPSDSLDCASEGGKQELNKYKKQPTWKQFKENGAKGYYRVTAVDFHSIISQGSRKRRSVSGRQARSATGYTSFTLGNDNTCDSQSKDVFCNGPLPEGKQFHVIVWACTSEGCTEATGVTITTLSGGGGTAAGPIIGAVVAVIVVAAVVTVIVVLILHRREMACFKKPAGESPGPLTPVRKPVALKDFTNHLARLHRDSNLLFQEEYEDIQERSPQHYTQEAALLDANKVKNRYVNVLPFDHTRVKLSTDDDDDSSDFINANYIPGYTSPREYIATQGPMVGTFSDFWKMIWEQKSSLIVMLSDLQEKGRPKVDMYWPGEIESPVQYGEIVVEMTTCSTLNKYTIRTFNIYKEDQKEDVRRVAQYFIPGWEDYSANLSADDVLDFISATRQEALSSQGPIVVHCSAGVGRTGTFVALDFLMQYVRDHSLYDEVDIFNLVLNMRHNRPLMVQSEKQYVFIHDTLKVIIDRKIQSMEGDNIYGNTISPDEIYINQGFVPEESLYANTEFKPTTTL